MTSEGDTQPTVPEPDASLDALLSEVIHLADRVADTVTPDTVETQLSKLLGKARDTADSSATDVPAEAADPPVEETFTDGNPEKADDQPGQVLPRELVPTMRHAGTARTGSELARQQAAMALQEVAAAREEAARILAAARRQAETYEDAALRQAAATVAKARTDAAALRDDALAEATHTREQALRESAAARQEADHILAAARRRAEEHEKSAMQPAAAPDTQHRQRRDSQQIPNRRRSRFRVRDWRMRTKLGTVLVIPSLAFMVVAGVQTNALVGQATVLDEFADQVALGQQITTLVHDLQSERDRTVGHLAALQAEKTTAGQAAADIRQYQVKVDDSVADFRDAARPLAGGDAAWQVALDRARDAVDDLPTLRGAAATGALGADTVIGNYTRTIDLLLTLLAQPSPGVERPELTQMVLRYVEIARIKEIDSRIRAQLFAAASAGRYGPTDQVELTDLRAQRLTTLADFRVAATNEQILRYEQAAADPKFGAASTMEQTTFATDSGHAKVLEPLRWWSLSQDRHDLLRQVESDVLGDAVDEAGARSTDQLQRTVLVASSVLTILLTALAISILISRSIARSLRELRRHALHVAQEELPDAIERLRTVTHGVPKIQIPPAAVRSTDEVGEVADAFVAVHRSAVDLAVEQAIMRRNVNAMFVNLARRSQVLVERQLELLDDLERDESDPDQLGNLFKLDHLAARMRRNDESLLVLAGTESSRRWNKPVALSTVALAAAAEIEQYPRVRHESVDNLYLLGHAVADVVHLLAELLENATNFSAPFTQVDMTTRASSDGTATIEIIDDGLGMTEAALEEANNLLAEPSAADVAASERMGLFVVSHLAARHSIRVRLVAAERGIIATVWLPPALLAPAPPARALPEPAARPAPAPASSSPIRGSVPPTIEAGTASRARRGPTRAEHVLRSVGAASIKTGSTWWSCRGQHRAIPAGNPARPPAASAAGLSPPSIPVTAGMTAKGLPLRIPLAQLPDGGDGPWPSSVQIARAETDPEAVSSLLSQYYDGIRQAEAEKHGILRRMNDRVDETTNEVVKQT